MQGKADALHLKPQKKPCAQYWEFFLPLTNSLCKFFKGTIYLDLLVITGACTQLYQSRKRNYKQLPKLFIFHKNYQVACWLILKTTVFQRFDPCQVCNAYVLCTGSY